MTSKIIPRRMFLGGLAALGAAGLRPAAAQAGPLLQVLKDANCGCCSAWIGIMQREGFQVQAQNVAWATLTRFKAQSGISEDMTSCHTGLIEGYVIEGHVPAADIRRLLADRPDAIGLSVPGMPIGSPGMGPETERDAYAVYLIRPDGGTEVYAQYEGG